MTSVTWLEIIPLIVLVCIGFYWSCAKWVSKGWFPVKKNESKKDSSPKRNICLPKKVSRAAHSGIYNVYDSCVSACSNIVQKTVQLLPGQCSGIGDYTTCSSPECVRCSKYTLLKSQAYEKLLKYTKGNLSEYQRLARALLPDSKRALDAIAGSTNATGNSDGSNSEQMPNVLFMSGLKAKPWWDCSAFSDVRQVLESNYASIVREFNRVYDSMSNCWVQNDTATGSWSVFHLYNQGVKIAKNCKLCPITSQLLHGFKEFMNGCVFGNASFSVMFPGTQIAEHCGPCNVRIRCHLGLHIPGKCQLTVAGESRPWYEGKCHFFDDSFWHSAVHHGPGFFGPRAVLLIDFWHPQLTGEEVAALRKVY